ncbi:PVC-type heme-binding CxxCH protein [Calycomorphotria hydatis]|nr:PVC-type heme-binding CxxCH protein [Calycomorphotria hydatis]
MITRITAMAVMFWTLSGPSKADSASGIQVPEGFEVTQYADDDLASDVFCMTTDSQGRIVVSGPGYIRILIDRDDDGRADTYRQFADGPRYGAQGLCFDGNDLIAVGDQGVLRYRNANGDDRADGPPEVLFPVKTGGEHHTHAIRRGADGWWYLIAGNYAEIDESDINTPASPIRDPEAGVLMRISPDFQQREVIAHGFRNAYDFAFNSVGDIFTYDSDGERDVTLPWYRPTRVFHVTTGSHAGFVSRSWKHPNYFPTMPPVIAELGRGSPCGVEVYQHHQFPPKYRDAVFVLDWTFGRVVALPLSEDGSSYKAEPILFAEPVGSVGFAPTDITVGPDGSLYISVGGRGTRGSIYRIRYGSPATDKPVASPPDSPMTECLAAPQPQSSWSRENWLPIANRFDASDFLVAAMDRDRPSHQRVRALQILSEVHDGIDALAAGRFTDEQEPEARVRAAAATAYLSHAEGLLDHNLVEVFLSDSSPLVVRCTLEQLNHITEAGDLLDWREVIADSFSSTDDGVRAAAMFAVARMEPTDRIPFINAGARLEPSGRLTAILAHLVREPDIQVNHFAIASDVIANQSASFEDRLLATRLAQLALGDVGPRADVAPVFDGFAPQHRISRFRSQLRPFFNRIVDAYPTDHPDLNRELLRLIAMLRPGSQYAIDTVLWEVTEDSHPTDDIVSLITVAQLPAKRIEPQTQEIASILLDLDRKIRERNLNIDLNWDARLGELIASLMQRDIDQQQTLLARTAFGRPEHMVFVEQMDLDGQLLAAHDFARTIFDDPNNYPWTPDVIGLLAKAHIPNLNSYLRPCLSDYGLRDAALIAMSEQAEPQDHDDFVQGLKSRAEEVVSSSAFALLQLPTNQNRDEQLALLSAFRQLEASHGDSEVRDALVMRLRENHGVTHGYQTRLGNQRSQSDALARWENFLHSKYSVEKIEADDRWAHIRNRLRDQSWPEGDVDAGRVIYEKRACVRCHNGRRALGPNLAGITKRFSRENLFQAIVEPDRDISSRYQGTTIVTENGEVLSGLIVYESADGLILRDARNQTYRVVTDEIEERRPMQNSLMPGKLLDGLSTQALADLEAYLKTL